MATITTINPVISVCIANYNGEQLLTECVQSVLNQSFAQPIEIIVHDDASTDHSVNLIRSQFPQVILVKQRVKIVYKLMTGNLLVYNSRRCTINI